MTTATTEALRTHVIALTHAVKGGPPCSLAFHSPVFEGLMRRLTRTAHCPDLDTLASALTALDGFRAAVESAHSKKAVRGIASLRRAMDGVEHFIENVELADPGREPIPDTQLDLPPEGFVARMMARFGATHRPLTTETANQTVRRSSRRRSHGIDYSSITRRTMIGITLGAAA